MAFKAMLDIISSGEVFGLPWKVNHGLYFVRALHGAFFVLTVSYAYLTCPPSTLAGLLKLEWEGEESNNHILFISISAASGTL